MIEEIKHYFFQKKLMDDAANNKAKRFLLNFADSREIGIAFDASDFGTITAVRDLELKLKQEGKKVQMFGYINNGEKKHEPFLFTNKDLNWYGYPIKNQLFDFAKHEFDTLLGIFNDINSPLHAIFANSKAKLRIGLNINQDNSLFDILIGSTKVNTTKDIISILTEFLTTVKTK
jgi:hypothetical protein